ncbi:MAG: transglycosylase family protein [Acidimicrobiia bacterium]|nr:transglycosylase family protein [Acidimicrobiia bacterium]
MPTSGDPQSRKQRRTRADNALEHEFWSRIDDATPESPSDGPPQRRSADPSRSGVLRPASAPRRKAASPRSRGGHTRGSRSNKLSGFGSVQSPAQRRAQARAQSSAGIWGPNKPSLSHRILSLPRGVRLATSGAVVLLVVLVASLAFRGTGTVEFSLNDELIAVSSSSQTVSEALDNAGVRLGDHDRVEPPGKTPFVEGMAVTVEVANVYTLQIDDAVRTVWSTGETPEEVVTDLGVQGVPVDRTRALQSGDLIVVRQGAASVTIIDGGTETPVLSDAGTVAELLASQAITLGANDTVVPLPESELQDGLRVTVVRNFEGQLTQLPAGADVGTSPSVPSNAQGSAEDDLANADQGGAGQTNVAGPDATMGTSAPAKATSTSAAASSATTAPPTTKAPEPEVVPYSEQVDVAFETIEQPDGNLPAGQSQLVQDGQIGRDVVHYLVTNPGPDQEVAEQNRERLIDPIPRIVRVGTKAPAPVANGATEAQLAHLRQCESGGNYSINTGNGYFGAYQFSPSTWAGLGYSGMPHTSPPALQDEAAQKLIARSGFSAWPTCAP